MHRTFTTQKMTYRAVHASNKDLGAAFETNDVHGNNDTDSHFYRLIGECLYPDEGDYNDSEFDSEYDSE